MRRSIYERPVRPGQHYRLARLRRLLRLSLPRAVVPIPLEPLIASFCQAYPDVEVETRVPPD
jgi:DNA-binding transcriptional LysR family regulator